MTVHAALFGANPTSKCPKTLDTDEAALEALPSALAAVEQTRLDVAQAFLSVAFCVEINQCVGCTRLNSSLSHSSTMTRPARSMVMNRHRHAIEQARRWP